MTRGRKAEWEAVIERLDGSALAKDRLSAALAVWTGQRTAAAACLQVSLTAKRFWTLRWQLLQAALASLEPRPTGRPARRTGAGDAQVAALQQQVQELQLDLRAAQLREEMALVLPQRVPGQGRCKKARRPRPGSRKRGAKSGTSDG
jgi:hypothetical protein